MQATINAKLYRALIAEIDRHADHHEAARTALNAAVTAALRSVGPGLTANFLRDAADLIEHETFSTGGPQ